MTRVLSRTEEDVNEAIDKYTNHLQYLHDVRPGLTSEKVLIETGRKYHKVIIDHGHQRIVHSFVDRKTGDLFKPASWNAPAKQVRYNLLTDMAILKKKMDPYGGYLYLIAIS